VTEMLPSIYGLSRVQLASQLRSSLGPKESAATADRRAEALFKSFYGKGLVAPDAAVRRSSYEALAAAFSLEIPVRLRDFQRSDSDGSVKFAVELRDGLLVETVLIPERGRLTQCLSTQVGCAQACRFCQTGRMGLSRSLTAEEIVGQVLAVQKWVVENPELAPKVLLQGPSKGAVHATSGQGSEERSGSGSGRSAVSNVVFMGMGEPLDTLEPLLAALDILLDPKGLGLSPNKVTVSTVGLLPQLETFLSSSRASLALSLHSPFEDERSRVMPVNQRHPITDVLAVLRRHSLSSGRRFLIQYTLIRNVNDSPAHAEAIANLLEGIDSKVNLIPLNEHEGTAYRRPGVGSVYDFQGLLKARGLVATVRLSKGRDIQAACGQLIEEKNRRVRKAPMPHLTSAAETESPTR